MEQRYTHPSLDVFRTTARLLVAMIATLTAVAASPADAHETDQFTLPPDGKLADLGPDVTGWYYDLLRQAVGVDNASIAAGLARHAPAEEMKVLSSDDNLVKAVDGCCQRGNPIVAAVEETLRSPEIQSRHRGERIFFRRGYHDIYQHAFWIWDSKILSRFWLGSTVKVFGTYLGTDKFGHFTAIGISYYWSYQKALRAGATEPEAMREAILPGTTGPGSEAGLLGLTTTGDYANGDLSANYAGFLFFRNLTQTVFVHGCNRPPLAVRTGPYWQLAPQVRRDSAWFRPFISDHWNEALNPGFFVEAMRPALRAAVLERTPLILRTFAPPDGSPPTAAYFRAKRQELSTYWGTDYGHRGDDDSLVSIDNTCFPRQR